jgi:transposase
MLALADKRFRCTDCGFEAGRDVNAALNLAAMGRKLCVSACGEARSGVVRKVRVKRASVSAIRRIEPGATKLIESREHPTLPVWTR